MKKNILTFLVFILFFQFSKAQSEFITVWKPSNTSSLTTNSIPYQSNSNQIWFPGKGNNFNVYWEEIGFASHTGTMNGISSTVNFLIDFGTPSNPTPNNATYKIWVTNGNGSFKSIKFGENNNQTPLPIPIFYQNGDALKLLQVAQWGTNAWPTFEFGFTDCRNMDVTATDIPNLSNLTNLSFMFLFCKNLIGNASFNSWNTSTVTNMRYLFATEGAFNQPVGSWDVSNVTDMGWMFHYLPNFNQPLNDWDTSNVTKMDHMFHGCANFNQPLNNWDTSNVTDMSTMFSVASSFNQPLNNWDVSSLIDFTGMFAAATNFNQNLGMWNLSSLLYASGVLQNSGLNCQNYDNTLYGWRMNPVTPNNITLGYLAPLHYSHSLAVDARNYLINSKNWIITGDLYDGECESSILATTDLANATVFQMYPNPASRSIFLKSKEKIKSVEIIDASGRLVSKIINLTEEIDVQQLQNGYYFIKIETENQTKILKFIKK